jgi:glucokinase
MISFSFPLLVCDIGGTNARFAYVAAPDHDLISLPPHKTADHSHFTDVLVRVLDDSAMRGLKPPRAMLISAAGPCEGQRIKLTNAQWDIKAADIMACSSIEEGMMFNDFEAQALSLPALRGEWLTPIGAQPNNGNGPRLISGPGTGLGTAALLHRGDHFISVPTESGHMDFAPVRDEEHEFWPLIEKRDGRITAEALISGPGLQRLHRARQAAHGFERSADDGVHIVAQALADPDSFEAQTIRAFWLLLARFVGDMAITFVATGGVILSGGIVPRIISLCPRAEFRRAFENKAPYAPIMQQIGVQMIHAPDTVLAGLAYLAAHPSLYLLDRQRLWA